MFISKLKISGFKSFADETVVTLNSGLNGVIGPNGSGKSNVVEAIKWVMGESSSKNLRGSGMNDVIFNGSASKASKNIAQVILTICVDKNNLSKNNKKYIKEGIVEVERQILRDTGSTYRINGKDVKAKEIQFLFADFSSGSRASNIIDQGTVGNLVTQKPLERRKILDESAGISGITARKVESSNKLEGTRRNLQRLSDILSSQKDRLTELRKQATKATSFKKNKEQILTLEKTVSVAKLDRSKRQLEKIKETYTASRLHLTEAKLTSEKIFNEVKVVKEDIKEIENKKKLLKDANLVLELKIEKVAYEIENNVKELTSYKNLEIQINKNISFQTDILNNSNARIQELKNNHTNFLKLLDKNKNSLEEDSLRNILKSLREAEELLSKSNNIFSIKKETVNRLNYELEAKKKKEKEIYLEVTLLKKFIEDYDKKSRHSNEFNNLTKKKKNLVNDNEYLRNISLGDSKSLSEVEVELSTLEKQVTILNEKENIQNNSINVLEKELSSYISLGFNNNTDNIIKYVNIKKGYELAFYLAIGDGIEASKNANSSSSVVWKKIKNKIFSSLPDELTPLTNYIKAPDELANFLSQVGVVKNDKIGNEIAYKLKNGQSAVTTNGSLWRWDGLYIKDGKKTITYKRITSTTKILELEKKIKYENKFLKETTNNKEKLEKIINKKQISKETILKRLELNQKKIEENVSQINNIEKSLLLNKNIIDKQDYEIRDKNKLITIKSEEVFKLTEEIKKLNINISLESKQIVQIKNKVSSEEKKVNELKEKLDKEQIKYAILKQREDAEKLNYRKILQEIKDTEYQINRTNSTLLTLNNDLKDVSKNIINNKSKPKALSEEAEAFKSSINKNNDVLHNLNKDYKKKSERIEQKEIKLKKYNDKIDNLKELTLRKEVQKEELGNFIDIEIKRIKDDIGIEVIEIEKFIMENIDEKIDIKETEILIRKLKNNNELIGNVNLNAEQELKELEDKVQEIVIEEKDLINAAKKLEKAIEELNKEARKRVKDTFEKMNITFSKLFKDLFGGGKAYLELIDAEDPLNAGLELMVSPPGKKLQRLTLLSGGEKALASLALIFSTFINKTTPICILDEVDAPLDDSNVEKFNILLKKVASLSEKRFIIITHNKITMSNMNQIFGITMMEPGVSKIVSVNVDKETSVHAAE